MRLFPHRTNRDVGAVSQPQPRLFRKITIFAMAALMLSLSAALLFNATSGVQKAHAATWTQVFDTTFTGANGSGLNSSVWKYDTGPGSSFGTGEIETMANSTANVFQDGQGHLVIKALRDSSGNWTS